MCRVDNSRREGLHLRWEQMQMKIDGVHKIRGNPECHNNVFSLYFVTSWAREHAIMFPTLMVLLCKVHDNLQVSGNRNSLLFIIFTFTKKYPVMSLSVLLPTISFRNLSEYTLRASLIRGCQNQQHVNDHFMAKFYC